MDIPIVPDDDVPPDTMFLLPADLAERLQAWDSLTLYERMWLCLDMMTAARQRRIGVIKNVGADAGSE